MGKKAFQVDNSADCRSGHFYRNKRIIKAIKTGLNTEGTAFLLWIVLSRTRLNWSFKVIFEPERNVFHRFLFLPFALMILIFWSNNNIFLALIQMELQLGSIFLRSNLALKSLKCFASIGQKAAECLLLKDHQRPNMLKCCVRKCGRKVEWVPFLKEANNSFGNI